MKILGLGDSVLNGGVQIDQKELATSILSQEGVYQMLNISAGSWGPDNCAAYLREKGLFNARAMVLVVSSHDAYDVMDFQPTVGVHKSYPCKQYLFAVWELIDRYLFPRLFSKKRAAFDPDEQVLAGTDIRKAGRCFNKGFDELKQIADSSNIPLLLYLHPDRREVERREYNEQGKEIIKWANLNQVPLYKGLDEGETKNGFRDGIHLNAEGQRRLAECMRRMLEDNCVINFKRF